MHQFLTSNREIVSFRCCPPVVPLLLLFRCGPDVLSLLSRCCPAVVPLWSRCVPVVVLLLQVVRVPVMFVLVFRLFLSC